MTIFMTTQEYNELPASMQKTIDGQPHVKGTGNCWIAVQLLKPQDTIRSI